MSATVVDTTTDLLVTANGYFVCPTHGQKWADGGNDVAMRPATAEDLTEFAGFDFPRCCDCSDALPGKTVVIRTTGASALHGRVERVTDEAIVTIHRSALVTTPWSRVASLKVIETWGAR